MTKTKPTEITKWGSEFIDKTPHAMFPDPEAWPVVVSLPGDVDSITIDGYLMHTLDGVTVHIGTNITGRQDRMMLPSCGCEARRLKLGNSDGEWIVGVCPEHAKKIVGKRSG